MTLTVGSLFAGVGGFDIAAEQAGMEIAWQSEYDKHSSAVLAEHWPEVTNYGDITQICGYDLSHTGRVLESEREPNLVGSDRDIGPTSKGHHSDDHTGECEYAYHPPRVDVLTGGFPCQDYSVAGRRGGLAGDRGALWWDYHRLITRSRPEWVVGENVVGLLNSNNGRDFHTIISSLRNIGYSVGWRVLDAQWFGVPQRRRRVFIVANLRGKPVSKVLALAEGMSGHPQPSREEGETIAGTLEARPTDSRYRAEPGHLTPFSSSGKDTIGTLTTAFGPKNYTNHQAAANQLVPQITGTVTTTWAKGPGNTQVDEGHVIPFAQNTRNEVRYLGNNIAGALAAQPGMKQQTYLQQTTGVRRLTPLECERLQGFPDNHTASQSDTQRYRQMGNAVAVPVVTWLLNNLNNTHKEQTA